MRAVLVGSVESSHVALDTLSGLERYPEAVITLHPELSRRHSDYVNLNDAVDSERTELLYTRDVNDPATIAAIAELAPDVVWVVGWSQVCRKEFLAIARVGTIGYHPSLLPAQRGRAVLPWTILIGASETGGTLFWLDEGVDSGPILAQARILVAPDETATTLYVKHMEVLKDLVRLAVKHLDAGTAPRMVQDHVRATYCAKRTWRDGLISWDQPSTRVWDLVRASTHPYPGAFTFVDGSRMTIWNAELPRTNPYIGLAGQVQGLNERGAFVMCGDGKCVLIKDVEFSDGKTVSSSGVLRMHQQLGVDLLKLVGDTV
jgi:methionyl-tRNA formyltransferase